ncbi:MAG: hypothetical protein UW63_C0021G0003 [Candidatus Uhrbacteria bacterium GW2011_GWF2_44_350]|uniref:Uncharacterized protein n=1 Tax=Candidatus Uhrbacteria bacterium GW2011_GWF2_44_350 TaxID=1619000 RepID=A0A0G1JHG2_9BACT|nr:MAG: hypothetical protein UW63_C0021G0003 [Candidatus Uhrbacteria bacterium GW2011_GWF2_44_350]
MARRPRGGCGLRRSQLVFTGFLSHFLSAKKQSDTAGANDPKRQATTNMGQKEKLSLLCFAEAHHERRQTKVDSKTSASFTHSPLILVFDTSLQPSSDGEVEVED